MIEKYRTVVSVRAERHCAIIVAVLLLTTMVTPPILAWLQKRTINAASADQPRET